jgi:LPS O-antigen subunit length determinant protein (WzzB/FepE family)
MGKSAAVEPGEMTRGTARAEPPDELDLIEILATLSMAKRRIAAFTVGAMILGTILSILLKPTFTATAVILTPQPPQSASSMLSQFGSLASLTTDVRVTTSADLYVGLLGSRTVADDIIAKYHLEEVYQTKTAGETRTALQSHTRILATIDGLIRILVDDHSAQRASNVANAYVDELYAMNSHLAITEAVQRRTFFERELADEKTALMAAEEDLRQTAEKTGVIQLNGQTESVIRSISQLRAQIASKEVSIQALRMSATDQNPDVLRAQEEVTALRSQLLLLEKDPRNARSGNSEIAGGRIPTVRLEYVRKFREVRYHETLLELLSKQYEAARIDEARAPLVQVLDRAIPPDTKTGPPRMILTLGFGALGLFLGCVVSLAAQSFRKLEQLPEYALKLALLRSAWRLAPPNSSTVTESNAQ